MLFGYPISATIDNWFHECLSEAIRSIHVAIDEGQSPPVWPNIFPEKYRATFKLRSGLKTRFQAYESAVRGLPRTELKAILKALEDENRIAELVSGRCNCSTISELPECVRKPVLDLFEFAFSLLTDLGIRDLQYAEIYAAIEYKLCPFCGLEYFDSPSAPRQALDHYLARSIYPFAAINLRNLVPMGHRCNSSYKGTNDLLRCSKGLKRLAFDPYKEVKLVISLDESEPFQGSQPILPRWDIKFEPDSPEISTWDDVFSVRDRYSRDHLDIEFVKWIGYFADWVKRSNRQINSNTDLTKALQLYEEMWKPMGLADRAFLKVAVFRMLRKHCEAGHCDLIKHLRAIVK